MLDTRPILEEIKQAFGADLRTIYQAGLSDGSSLSDLDLIIVAEKTRPFTSTNPCVDLRGIYSPEQFATAQSYLPYTQLTCLYGTPIAAAQPAPSEAPIIKLGGMFFYAFLRNFYRDKKSCNVKAILTHLNDFEYANVWMPGSVSGSFLARIRQARKQYPNVGVHEAKELLLEGIEAAWEIVKHLDTELQMRLQPIVQPYTKRLLRENTAFMSADAPICRTRSEKISPLFKKLYLPMSFSLLFGQPENSFAAQYVKRNLLGPKFGAKGWIKHQLKMLV